LLALTRSKVRALASESSYTLSKSFAERTRVGHACKNAKQLLQEENAAGGEPAAS